MHVPADKPEGAARSLEAGKVDLIVTFASSVTLATKRATKSVPIVFYAGADPVTGGLVESIRKPGGQLTGIYGRTVELTPKRFELRHRVSRWRSRKREKGGGARGRVAGPS